MRGKRRLSCSRAGPLLRRCLSSTKKTNQTRQRSEIHISHVLTHSSSHRHVRRDGGGLPWLPGIDIGNRPRGWSVGTFSIAWSQPYRALRLAAHPIVYLVGRLIAHVEVRPIATLRGRAKRLALREYRPCCGCARQCGAQYRQYRERTRAAFPVPGRPGSRTCPPGP